MENEKKLVTKDFINLGIFSAISMCALLVAAIVNISPYTMLLYSPLYTLLNGIIFLFIMIKVPKRGSILLFAVISIVYFLTTGMEGIIAALSVFISALLGEIILWNKREQFIRIVAAYIIYSCSIAFGGSFRLFLFTDSYLSNALAGNLDKDYVEVLRSLATYTNWVLTMIATVIAAVISCLAGKKILKKHFERVGII